tara:strand:- start:37160 stop:38440 length:1281 start_codon:yes stop_codon:yes gene_type:complete
MLLDIWVEAYKNNINEVRRDNDSQIGYIEDAIEDVGGVEPGEVVASKKIRGVSKKSSLIAVNKQGVPRAYSVDPTGKAQAEKWAAVDDAGELPHEELKAALDNIFSYAAQIAVVLNLDLASADMRMLSRYIKTNYGGLQKSLDTSITEAIQSFDFDDEQQPSEIAMKFIKVLSKSGLFTPSELDPLATAVKKAVEDDVLIAPPKTTSQDPVELNKYDQEFFNQSKKQLLRQLKAVSSGNRRDFLFNMLRDQSGLEGKNLESSTQRHMQSFEKMLNSSDPNDLTEFISLLPGMSDAVKKFERQLKINTKTPLEESLNPKSVEYYPVGFNLTNYKKHRPLNEGYLQMFGGWLQYIMKAMFGNLNIPVNITGKRSEVDALVGALSKERSYIDTISKYSLDDERTYKSKSKLDRAVKSFESETGLKWPFK